MAATKSVVIYTRYSTDMQREESCEDQARMVRGSLTKMGIDHGSAVVIEDKAIPGSRDDRLGFQEVLAMSGRGEIAILAVDEQSRFSRGGNAYSLIQDLVYGGGRFISTSEGIDTTQNGWKLRIKVGEINNEQSTDLTAHRVRRGMEGRVLDDGSAGDFPYGYESYYIDPDAALRLLGRGPKPKKEIRIREEHAAWVRTIFEWFAVHCKSMTQIAKDLNFQQAARRERVRVLPWRAYAVREILTNEKYIGDWQWGKSKTIRNSHGKKKYVPVDDPKAITIRTREDLRIIDDNTWQATVARLARNKSISGRKPGQKPRGWFQPGHDSGSKHILSGLLVCSECGHRLFRNGAGDNCTMYCPQARIGECGMKFSVKVRLAEAAIVNCIGDFLRGSDAWLDRTLARTRELVRTAIDHVPAELATVEKQIRDKDAAAAELVKQLAEVGPAKDIIRRELDKLATTLDDAKRWREQLQASIIALDSLPNADWFRDQLRSLPDICQAEPGRTGNFLRRIVGSVSAYPILMPGKVRGYTQLRFRIQPWRALLALGDGSIPASLASLVHDTDDQELPQIVLDIGGPTKSDRLRPIVAEMRQQGLTVPQIAKQLGENVHNIEAYCRRR